MCFLSPSKYRTFQTNYYKLMKDKYKVKFQKCKLSQFFKHFNVLYSFITLPIYKFVIKSFGLVIYYLSKNFIDPIR